MKRYPGLSPFTAEQKSMFFGRDNDIKKLSKLIFVERKVLLYSKSGYGKTSLLNAGVIPELKKNKEFEFIPIRFHSYTKDSSTNTRPSQTFLREVKKHGDFKAIDQQNTLIDQYAKEQRDKYWSVFKKNQLLGNKDKTYILVFDQFEELFTYPKKQINEFKNQFTEIILANKLPDFFEDFEDHIFENKAKINKKEIDLLYNPINIKAVFSMRSDRLSKLNHLADKISDIQKIHYPLQALTKEQAQHAIEKPAKEKGDFESPAFQYQSKAITKILNALTDDNKQKIETTQLQIICQRIEEELIDKNTQKGEEISIKAEEIPNFDDIFLHFYNDSIAKVKSDTQNIVRKFIEKQLISEDGQRITLDEITCQKAVKQETLDKLVNARLLRAERNSVERISYELSHDTLVPPIKKLADQRREREELERLKKKQREQRKTIIFSVLIASVSIGAAIFGLWQKNIAEKQTQIANKAKIRSDSLRQEADKALENFISEKKRRKEAQIKRLIQNANSFVSFREIDLARAELEKALAIDSTNMEVKNELINLKNQ